MYQLRNASQGEAIYLNVHEFLLGKGTETKAYHHKYERVGLQESSQNNFRRIISCRIPSGHFCNHKINYTTARHSTISLEIVLFVLNSSFADWYFRLGSTNAAVSHYQLTNIPCPIFGKGSGEPDSLVWREFEALLNKGEFSEIERKAIPLAKEHGCTPTLQSIIARLVRFIETEESNRGDIARTQRSHLSENATKCQVVLDKTLLALFELGDSRHEYITQRLKEML